LSGRPRGGISAPNYVGGTLGSLAALSAVLAFPAGQPHYVASVLCVVASLVLGRLIATELQRRIFITRILILGGGQTAATIIDEIESTEHSGYLVAGVVSQTTPKDGSPSERWVGRLDELSDIVGRLRPSRIVLAFDRREQLPLTPLLESRVRGVPVEDAWEFYERLTGTVPIEALTPGELIHSAGFRNSTAANWTARAISVIVASLGLLVLLPVLILIAIAIKLDSRGPVLFVQERSGKDGRVFPLFKFRTMHPAHEHRSEWVQDNEERVTGLGRWLRRFRIDELPQFINILRGEMNLVGPRPHPVSNQRLFVERIAFYSLRSAVLPGLTGWAQVRYRYANTLEEETEKMRHDLYYIKNRSVWLDFGILLATMLLVVRGDAGTVRSPARLQRLASRRRPRTRVPVT
jgi:exopolysaccharide biosynthesis polyprenyl glycosylphosphotransferase